MARSEAAKKKEEAAKGGRLIAWGEPRCYFRVAKHEKLIYLGF